MRPRLAARVADVRPARGGWLIHEGEQPSFFLLIEGSLEVRKVVHGQERRITELHQGDYFGELPPAAGVAGDREPARSSPRASRSSIRMTSGNFSRHATRSRPS